MDFTIQEAINLITHFYTPLPGYWKDDYESYPEARRFIDAGFASFEDEREDKYILNQEGGKILHSYIEQISLNLIDYSKKNGFQIFDDETIPWFMKEYKIAEDIASEIYEYICVNLSTYEYRAERFLSPSMRKGYKIDYVGKK